MTATPVDPNDPAVQAAVQQLLAQQAQGVGGTDSAGIYGDQAGASQVTPEQTPAQTGQALLAAGGTPNPPGLDALVASLQAQIDQMNAKLADQAKEAAAAAEAAAPKPPSLADVIDSSSFSSAVAHAFRVVEERLAALEGHSG